ncbi:pimeloyl-ACP methyl esterase BioG family protein [Campylobacter geochelonis]|uniref:pimeloyl-ACP methyl esterase BioG family protein n=1 Tax=Campylobacter geochelonis TaxID=1780362 RepID=UPI000770A3EF|nr:pimeloyl-ACP methyl esterase BioG family protein [Campylobacter geochelonis]CZE51258.1 Biotin synthesis protein BioG [Campylobacter geochelonis]
MKLEIVKNSGGKVVLLFLGYSFLPECVKHLELGEFDLYVVYDYCDMKLDTSFLQGKELYLVAWSMGVWACSLALKGFEFKKAIAINGTPCGIDDEFGIAKMAFKKSIDEFDFDGFKKICFLKDLEKINFSFNKNAKLELENIYKNSDKKAIDSICWDKAIISKKDFVFPPKSCEWFKCQKEFINAPHFPFFYYKSFGEILEIPKR